MYVHTYVRMWICTWIHMYAHGVKSALQLMYALQCTSSMNYLTRGLISALTQYRLWQSIAQRSSITAETAVDVRGRVGAEIGSFRNYCYSNMMSLNKAKTKWMLVFPDERDQVADILLEGALIERVTTFKYLGVILDQKLDFREQTCSLISRIKRTIYVCNSSFKLLLFTKK
jgi:hypothetical protein